MKKIWLAIKNVYKKDYIKTISVFLFLFSSYGLVYFSVNKIVSLDDPLFHIRFAEIIKERGIDAFRDFHWLYFSHISEDQSYFVYYSFLFYLVLIPFTYIKPLILAIKLYGVFSFSLLFTTLYYFLLKIKIKKPFLWIIITLALINYGVLSRFLVARSFTLAPALLLIELYFLYRKKYWGVFLISIIYFYWHTATFFFPLMVAVCFAVFESFYGRKINFKLVFNSASGIFISFIATAFFAPGIFHVFNTIFEIFSDTIIGKNVGIAEGNELYPADFFDYIKTNLPIMVLFILAVVFEIRQYLYIRRDRKNFLTYFSNNKWPLKGVLFFLSLSFFLGMFLTKRFEDFFVFFSVAYIIVSFNDMIKYINIKNATVKKSIFSASLIVCGSLFFGNMLFIQDRIASVHPYDSIKGAAEWIKNNADKNEVIFHTTWNWFPMLFYYNTNNYYITGLEPRVLYDYDHELYWVWRNISESGYICAEEHCDKIKKEQRHYLRNEERKKEWYKKEGNRIADYIQNNFQSRFVLTSKSFANLNEVMDNNDRFEKVFTDNVYNKFYIYEIH